jgi:hypothetical protein
VKVKSASLDLYNFVFLYFYDCEYDEYRAYLEEHFGEELEDDEDEATKAICVGIDHAKVVTMWFSNYDDLPVVVHECVHAANFVFDYICHNQGTDNDEPMAYLTEWIFKQALAD